MSYTRDYIFEKIIEKLPTLKIHEKKEDDSSIFILEYKNSKAKIDIDSFVKKLGNKKTRKKLTKFIFYIIKKTTRNGETTPEIKLFWFFFFLNT